MTNDKIQNPPPQRSADPPRRSAENESKNPKMTNKKYDIQEREACVGARHAVPLQPRPLQLESFGKPVHGSLPTIIRSFKSAVTKRINALRGTCDISIWQRNYYDHVIRDESDLNKIRKYITENPMRWSEDRNNPVCWTSGSISNERSDKEPLHSDTSP